MMSAWHWPQWFMASIYTLAFLAAPLSIGKVQKPKTETHAVIGIILNVVAVYAPRRRLLVILDYFKSRARLVKENRQLIVDNADYLEIAVNQGTTILKYIRETDSLEDEVAALKAQLARFERVRDPETGKFVKVQ